EVPREEVEEPMDHGLVEPQARGELKEQRPELPLVQERSHEVAVGQEVLVCPRGHVEEPIVGDGLRDLCRKDEVVRGEAAPALDLARRRGTVEGRIDLCGVEHAGVGAEFRLARVAIEGTDPLLIVPSAAAESEAGHRPYWKTPAIHYH